MAEVTDSARTDSGRISGRPSRAISNGDKPVIRELGFTWKLPSSDVVEPEDVVIMVVVPGAFYRQSSVLDVDMLPIDLPPLQTAQTDRPRSEQSSNSSPIQMYEEVFI